jgi:tellurite resistance protein TerC
MSTQTAMWIGFNVVVFGLLIFDLKVLHRKARVESIREALLWAAFWISLALLFNLGIYLWQGPETALEFLTAYLVEESLSVDNLFVFLLIFSYFAVPPEYQHRVLFWGILGAIVLRVSFILAGVALLERFHWVIYVFGGFLIFTAIRMAFQKETEVHPERNPVLRLVRRVVPVTDCYEGDKFFVKRLGRYVATPLFIVVLVIETTDIVFAVDSIPAVLGITQDRFIAYTSNVCAILGLRAIYFALAGIMRMFKYLHYGLMGVLFFIGVKMVISEFYVIPIGIALGVVGGILLASVVLSIIVPDGTQTVVPPAPADAPAECATPDAEGKSE